MDVSGKELRPNSIIQLALFYIHVKGSLARALKMNFLKGPRMYYRLLGAKGLLLGAKARLLRRHIGVVVTIPYIKHPVRLRLRSTDIELCQEVLVKAQYELKLPKSPQLIVDAGANIGLTSIFFANRYPEASIIAVEPDSSNYEILRKNIAPYSNIVAVRAALWDENKEVNLVDPGAGQTAYQTQDRPTAPNLPLQVVPGITVDKLMSDFNIRFIDLLKIDIEGSEKEVFERSSSWISSVGVIAIEIHDWIRTGCGEAVRRATKDFDREWQQGEIKFLARKHCDAKGEGETQSLPDSRRQPLPPTFPLRIVEVT
jgi:FkbM family methyltransferase